MLKNCRYIFFNNWTFFLVFKMTCRNRSQVRKAIWSSFIKLFGNFNYENVVISVSEPWLYFCISGDLYYSIKGEFTLSVP